MRDRVMQLDGPGDVPYAGRIRALEALSRERGRIAAELGRQRYALAARAGRLNDRAAAVEAVRAGEAQAAAEVLERNAAVQAGLVRLMAIADQRGDLDTLAGLIEQFNLLADQSETLAPSHGRVGLSGIADLTAALRVVATPVSQPASGYVPPPPGTGPTVSAADQRAQVDARLAAERECRLDVFEDLAVIQPPARREWELRSSLTFTPDPAQARMVRQGDLPFRLRGDCWETWDERTRRHRIFKPTASPLEGLPAAIESAWDKVAEVAQTAADLACKVASNAVVQTAATKLGPSASGTVASVNAYACQRASKPSETPAAPPVASAGGGAAVGFAAALAALVALL